MTVRLLLKILISHVRTLSLAENVRGIRPRSGITRKNSDTVANDLLSAAIHRNALNSARVMVTREYLIFNCVF
jgi:hypothetical protein